jgi:hypothetical protein
MSAMIARTTPFLRWFALLTTIALAACQSTGSTSSFPPVAAPRLTVGDHWQYRITDNLRRGAVTMLDAEVVSITGGTAKLRLVYNEPTGRSEQTEEIDANGGLVVGALKEEQTRRFPTPLELYQFPLQAGQTWRQTVDTTSPETQLAAQILVYGTVQTQTQATVPGGSFDAIYVYRIVQLDDEQFFRTRTSRRDYVWFVPQVKGVAKETRDASYVLFGGGVNSVVRTENTTRELLSFRPGA